MAARGAAASCVRMPRRRRRGRSVEDAIAPAIELLATGVHDPGSDSLGQGRPTWCDRQGNHWARPATGDGHHRDVYLTQALAEEYGLGQLTITRWGAPTQEGPAGSLHHVPRDKQGRLEKKTG
jgi:hypothetical protein